MLCLRCGPLLPPCPKQDLTRRLLRTILLQTFVAGAGDFSIDYCIDPLALVQSVMEAPEEAAPEEATTSETVMPTSTASEDVNATEATTFNPSMDETATVAPS